MNKKTYYALCALTFLGARGEVCCVSELAYRLDISKKYLEQVMTLLKKAQFVDSKKGANGGCWLNKKPEEISLYDVLYAVEGEFALLERMEHPNCKGAIFEALDRCNSQIINEMKSVTLVEMIKRFNEKNNDDVFNFVI